MAIATQGTASNYLQRAPSPSGLADVLDLILDKGLVIDAYVRVAVIGIELITIDARIVIASVDTYLRFAEAVNRLDLMQTETQGLPELMEGLTESGASSKTKGMLQGAKEAIFGGDEDEEDEDQGNDEEGDEGSTRRRRSTSTTTKRRRRSEASGSGSSRGRAKGKS